MDAKRLNDLYFQHNLTSKHLASCFGVTRQTLSNWLNSHTPMPAWLDHIDWPSLAQAHQRAPDMLKGKRGYRKNTLKIVPADDRKGLNLPRSSPAPVAAEPVRNELGETWEEEAARRWPNDPNYAKRG